MSSRKRFLQQLSIGLAAPILSPLAGCANGRPGRQEKEAPAPGGREKLGIALVGLGSYSAGQLAPALQETKDCYLAGVVTGTPSKGEEWARKYGIPQKNIYNYSNFDAIRDNADIDIVYVVLPIFLHKEFTIRAARAGKHVICEKPMALNAAECEEMIRACAAQKKLLSIGYRLHFEPHNMEMMRLGQQQVYGPVKEIECGNGFIYRGNPEAWRLKKREAGGGGLMDMGVYAIQGARYTTGEEPVWVEAREEKTRPEIFREVDETIYFTLGFPSGATAKGVSSYNKNLNYLKATAGKSTFELTEAYRYGGIRGRTPEGPMPFDPNVNQQALHMDDFARCVRTGTATRVPGEMGLRDMKVIDAIYGAIASGGRVRID